MADLGVFVVTNLWFCPMHWALPAGEWPQTRWCAHPDGNSRDCHFVQLYYRDEGALIDGEVAQ